MKVQSGEYAPKTGAYKMVKNGKTINTVHVSKGEKMPPTMDDQCHFEID